MADEKTEEKVKVLETEEEKRQRWKSVHIIYFTTFLMGLSFGIVLTSIWPYLDSLDPHAGKIFMGWIVAANPMGQMIFSPLIGWWSNKSKTFHAPLLFCAATFIISNLWFATLEMFPDNRKYWMFISRFLVGMSSSNVVICRSYIAAATTLEERTKAMSMMALMQVLGFTVGPAIQAAVSPLGSHSKYFVFNVIPVNMYTVIGWLNVFCGIVDFICCLPVILKYKLIAARQIMLIQNVESEKATWKTRKPDYLSAFTLISAFGTLNFVFSLLESNVPSFTNFTKGFEAVKRRGTIMKYALGTSGSLAYEGELGAPISMDQFGWTKKEALFYMGLLMAIGAIVAIFGFLSIAPLSRLIGENKLLIWAGFQLMIFGSLFCIPWGPHFPPIAQPTNNSDWGSDFGGYQNETELVGCPVTQEWCNYTPAVTLVQFITSYLLVSLGYPIGIALIPTIFTKVLGPRPQGTWMGMMIGSGCFARMLGPIFITFIYTKYGTTWSFSLISMFQMIMFLWLLLLEKRFTKVIASHTKRIGCGKGNATEMEMDPLSNPQEEQILKT